MSDPGRVPLPRYGDAALADLVPSILTAMDVPGFVNPLGLEPVDRVALLLVDGLGWDGLKAHAAEAPFLHAAAGDSLTAGFPATTAASVASIGTGKPPGTHGVVGYSVGRPGHDHGLNVLQWTTYGPGPGRSLLDEDNPEEFQPQPTAFERAVAAGVDVVRIAPRVQAHSGLTRAALRGGRFVPVVSLGDVAAQLVVALNSARRVLAYGYHADLDLTGHVRGVASDAWRLELANVDALVRAVVDRLPRRSLLVVTGDHGMVDVAPENRVDFDASPELQAGVRYLAGEGRARHVFTRKGAAADVKAAWSATLEDAAWVATRDEAVNAGWFGPVSPTTAGRIGDVVVAARADIAIVSARISSTEAALIGHHGSFTAAEQLVPFVAFRT